MPITMKHLYLLKTEINILEYVEVNTAASTREIGPEVQISHKSDRQILKKHDYIAFFKYQLHQLVMENTLTYCD